MLSDVRTPSRRERRRRIHVPEGTDLSMLAPRMSYVGSAEHKTYPSEAGRLRPRADATKCDPRLHGDFEMLTEQLRSAVIKGQVGGPWESDFPRYVWAEIDDVWYEARLVNRGQGTYKGWEARRSELPEGLWDR